MYIRRAARLLTATVACACASAIALPGATAAPASPAPAAPAPAAGPHAFAPAPYTTNPSPEVRREVEADAKKALSAHGKAAFRGSSDAFEVRNLVVDRDGSASVRFDRTYKGLPTYGGDVIVQLKKDGTFDSLTSAAQVTTPALSTEPGLTAARAAKLSKKKFGGPADSVSKPHLAVRLDGDASALVWETVVSGVRADQTPSRLHVLVDANSGKVLATRDEVSVIAPEGRTAPAAAAASASASSTRSAAATAVTGRSIYSGQVSLDATQSGGGYSLQDPSHGNGYTTNLNHATSGQGSLFTSSTGTFGNGSPSDPASAGADAHYGAAMTFDYFKTTHGRNGIFGDGRGVPSRTHYGNAYVNAFWDGSQMTYGDGQGNQRPLVELDVAGHEMAHGVSGALTGWDETGETGGMNEGTSDIFGTLVEFYADNPVDQPDYTMGELINISGNNQPLRWMNQPSLDGSSPDCWNSNNGNLDPHYSMGPLNHWFFLTAVGSGNHGYGNSPTCNNSTINGLGNDKAGKIWYKALASYANSRENYHQARIDSLKAAADLYGAHCTEYNTVDAAWAAVSVTGADPVPGNCDSQPGSPSVTNPGNQTSAVGTAVSLQIQASDPGGETLTYSANGLPAGLSINSSTGRVTGTPTTEGTSSVTVTAKNTDNATGTASFTWTVNGDGNPPQGCGDVPAWSSTTAYAPGDQVSYNGHLYSSQWYSTGAEPGAPGSWAVWTESGTC
ncbi:MULTISPECIES: M4 family metallopeptidase [unclassified Streptomyces]|uniref:M4 family metallopeptidase n=1 Tax=unclassified Streptomyces TaxID=2593676 RepID=UPI000DAC1A18|nr:MULTISPECIES: M4 family metallopeptidase [unclassified Streptomyces]PZT76445.1 peptidase [Streptomyces sp. AC1-42W]PZT79598.1 peptidase [Streptomyces sp. AC1-42T]